MTILVTGAGGFIGRTLVEMLLAQDKSVVAFDRVLEDFPARDGLTLIEGDLVSSAAMDACFEAKPNACIHLAAVPGGTAEQDPMLSLRVNVEGTIALMTRLAASNVVPRFVYASSIAVYGDPLPEAGVDDQTPLRPKLYYGMHKLMAEQALATLSRRGEIDGVGLRLPGIVARPKGPSGMKSAFMSDIFHSLKSGESITLPVSQEATLWLMSVKTCARNLIAALTLNRSKMPENCVVTLPALKVQMTELVTQICAHLDTRADGVRYAPDPGLEAAFGTHPDLNASAAERAGLVGEKSAAQLVSNVLGANK